MATGEKDAYEVLRAYLDHGEARLGANPDPSEIIADLEQAIVVTAVEIGQVLEELGPVDGGLGVAAHTGADGAQRSEAELLSIQEQTLERYEMAVAAMSAEVMSGMIWLAYQYVPAVHDVMQQFPWWADRPQQV